MSRFAAIILTACVITVGSVLSFVYRADAPIPDQTENISLRCPADQTIEQLKGRADIILIGSVFAVLQNNDGSADVLITPQNFYKGSEPERGITIAARPATGGEIGGSGNSDLHFSSDDPPYLFFLTERSDGRFQTSRCDGSRLLGQGLTTGEQAALGSGRL